MLDAVEFVINEIEKNKIESISQILRIKNGFNNILGWKSEKDYNYVDLKMNVIFNNKSKTECQIVELQFLLDFLLKAKKMGHKYYGIKRKDVEINSVCSIMYNRNNNYDRYKAKIGQIIKDNDINQLQKHLFLRPNCILSMIDQCSGPYLKYVGDNGSIEMYELFLDCIFHFGEILLNEKQPLNYNVGCYKTYDKEDKSTFDSCVANQKLFIQKYLNFSLGDNPCIDYANFVKYSDIQIGFWRIAQGLNNLYSCMFIQLVIGPMCYIWI